MTTVGVKRDLASVTDDSDLEDATNYFYPNLWMDLSVVLELNRKMRLQTSKTRPNSKSADSSPTSLSPRDLETMPTPSVVSPSLHQIQLKEKSLNSKVSKKPKSSLHRRRRVLPVMTPSNWRGGSSPSAVNTVSEKKPTQTLVSKESPPLSPHHIVQQDAVEPAVATPEELETKEICSPKDVGFKDAVEESSGEHSEDDGESEGGFSPSSKNNYLIQQVSLYDGTIVATYSSVGKAAKAIDASPSAIYLCLSGKRKYAKGFFWKKTYQAPTYPYFVQQINIADGAVVATYSSVPEAAEVLGCTKATIYNCLSGKRGTAVGFYWKKLYPIKDGSDDSSSACEVSAELPVVTAS